jgi:hypothetical protein
MISTLLTLRLPDWRSPRIRIRSPSQPAVVFTQSMQHGSATCYTLFSATNVCAAKAGIQNVSTRDAIIKRLKPLFRRHGANESEADAGTCPICSAPIHQTSSEYESLTHNPETCRLVNLVLLELGITIPQTIRVNIYPGAGPLRGFYFTADPYTIHISEDAYTQLREYVIFHETKHLVDCLRFGRSEELTPDRFARSLCLRYGYRCPPEGSMPPWFAYA